MLVRFTAVLAVVLLYLASTQSADAQIVTSRTNLYLVIEPNIVADTQSRTIQKNGAILETVARAPRAVKLTQDVTLGSIGTGVNFKAGDILFGRYDNSVWTYCGIAALNAESRVANAAVMGVLTAGFSLLLEPLDDGRVINCLTDADNDGVFDTGWGAGDTLTETSMVAFNVSRKSLSATPGYERVAPSLGPSMPVEIKWSKNGNAGTITFRTEIGGTGMDRVTTAIPANGSQPVEVKMTGATFMLEGYDAETRSIRVKIKEGIPNRYVRIPAVRTVTYTYY